MRNSFKKKGTCPALEMPISEQMLINVFHACGWEMNTVPLPALMDYTVYRRERFFIQRRTLAVILILFLLLPLLFIKASLTVEENDHSPAGVSYRISVSSLLPVRHVTAEQNGKNLTLSEGQGGNYTLQTNANGEITLSLTLANGQVTRRNIAVTGLDTENPCLLASAVKGDAVELSLADDGSGIQWESITVITSGGVSSPLYYDIEKGIAAVPYGSAPVTVTVPDAAGNVLNILLNPS